MITLAIDTATPDLVVGLVEGDENPTALAGRAISDARGHNERLVPAVVELLDEAGLSFGDLGRVVVGRGPGPFTGLRVGMAAAAAIAQARGIPVYQALTHDAIAAGLGPDEGRVLVVTDARRREVYWALYEGGRRVAGPGVGKPAELDVAADKVAGEERLAALLGGGLADLPRLEAALTPEGLVAAADLGAEPGPLEPAYLRRPDAAVPPPPKRVLGGDER